jgi:ectoine hydroxylase-related dioxygenase (phytanoyl-CoA dioxygenase family)
MFKKLINILYFPLQASIFLIDLIKYKIFKIKNFETSHQFMVKLFCLTGGFSNTIISKFLSLDKIPMNFFHSYSKDIPKLDELDIKKAQEELNDRGFYLKENFLDDQSINDIKNFLFKLKGNYISDQFSDTNKYELNLTNPKGVQFRYDPSEILECHLVQNILTNRRILEIANNYLNALPLMDDVYCWWSFKSEKADSASAQMWHFDMDRPKWIKVFIFLTDCTDTSGPHSFIAKTHKNGSLPKVIRNQGYSRLNNDLIKSNFCKEDVIRFVTKKGSILFEDTRGVHKGEQVLSGNRLILQFQFSSAIFGSKTPKINFPKNKSQQFTSLKKNYPNLFINFR